MLHMPFQSTENFLLKQRHTGAGNPLWTCILLSKITVLLCMCETRAPATHKGMNLENVMIVKDYIALTKSNKPFTLKKDIGRNMRHSHLIDSQRGKKTKKT